jgi:hypothetical protein
MAIKVSKPSINLREALSDLKQDTGLKGQELMRADTVAEARTAIGAGRKNLIINGGMGVAQRSTSAITVANDSNEGYQTIDRMLTIFNASIGGAVTVQRVDDAPAGIVNALKYVVTSTTTPSGNQYFGLEHKLESQNLQSVGYGTAEAKDMTLSFYMKSSNYSGSVSIAAYHSDAVRYFTATAGTPNTAWKKYSVVIPANTASTFNKSDNGEGLRLRITLDCSSTNKVASSPTGWTSTRSDAITGDGHFMATSGNDIYITGIQLELGSVATEFEHRSYGEELALCQRYYQVLNFSAYGPLDGYYGSGNYMHWCSVRPVRMRADPASTITYGTVHNLTDNPYIHTGDNAENCWVSARADATGRAYAVFTKYIAQSEL